MKKTKKGLKRFLTFVVASLLLVVNVKAYTTNDFLNAQSGGTLLKDDSSVKVGKSIPKEYADFAIGSGSKSIMANDVSGGQDFTQEQISAYQNTSDTTEKNAYAADSQQYLSYSKKGFTATYPNVGVYDGHVIDVKLTIMDFENSSVTNSSVTLPPYIYFTKGKIGVGTHNVNWVDVKVDFIDHSTKQPVNVKGNTTYWDVDIKQGILLDSTNKGIYISGNDNVLKSTSIDSKKFVFDPTGETCGSGAEPNNYGCNAHEMQTPAYAFTEVFSGSSIRRVFNFLVSTSHSKTGGGILFDAEAVVETETPVPTKKVNKTTVSLGEEYTYTINETVPQMLEQYYYKTFALEDVLEDCLKVDTSKVTVKNENGEDVTSWFTITNEGQKITAQLKEANNKASFYGHTYTFSIKTSIKTNVDLSKWKKGNDYIIPNQAKIKITDYNNEESDQPTEIVNVIYTPEVIDNVPSTSAALPLYISIIGVLLVVIATAGIIYTNRKKENK